MNTTGAAMNGAVMSNKIGILEADTQNNVSNDWRCVAEKRVS